MPKTSQDRLLERVDALLRQHPEGLRLLEIEESLQEVSRRTLQRRLAKWTSTQAIRTQGVRRGRRYFSNALSTGSRVITPPTGALSVTGLPPEIDENIPLSIAAREVQALVRRPLTDRQPIGYETAFLEKYIPNDTAYLSGALRSHLHELGRTPEKQRTAGTYARDILDRLLIDLSWSSSRLEGNTYSLLDTRELIKNGTVAPGKDAKETQMILNHKAAIELLVESVKDIGVNRYTITNLHALLAENLLDNPRDAGRLRDTPIAIGASTYIPTAIPQLIENMFTQLLKTADAIQDPFEQSFFLLVHIPYLQPFVDANKRTSRLASNIPLITRNLVPLSFIDVPERLYVDGLIGIYEQNRLELLGDVYLWAYERSVRQYKTVRDSLPEPDPFRLQYRAALSEVVAEVVRQGLPTTKYAISKLAIHLVSTDDVNRFTRLVLEELQNLHEGNIARFKLRPSEFQRWRAGAKPSTENAAQKKNMHKKQKNIRENNK